MREKNPYLALRQKIPDWDKDWETHRKINGMEYTAFYPHLPRITYKQWCDFAEALHKAFTLK